MSTPESVKGALQTAINQANTTTGKNDSTITDTVASLVEGYGQGGESSPAHTEGSFTPATSGMVPIEHGLGVTPRIFICWLDKKLEDFPLGVYSFGALIVINVQGGLLDAPWRINASQTRMDGLIVYSSGYSDTAVPTNLSIATPNSAVYGLGDNSNGETFNEEIVSPSVSGYRQSFAAGFTYKWIAFA